MTEPATGDIWSEWLLKRRFPADPAVAADWKRRLEKMRDGVLERARIEPGNVLLDVGTGDGLIAFGALEQVGPSGRVIFSDISQPLLDESRRLAEELGVLDRCEFLNASADNLTAVAEGSVDVVTTRSVLIYVKEKAESFREFFRVLRPGGRISLFEPINRASVDYREQLRQHSPVPEIRDLKERLRVYWESLQPPDDPMLDFDERDLVRLALEAGFEEVHLRLDLDVTLSAPMSWDGWVSSAGNPKIPSLAEAMNEVFDAEERARYERTLRPVIERGGQPTCMAIAWIQATKHAPEERMADSAALTTPLTDDVIDGLTIGQHVTFTGVIYTARDAAHKRLIEMANRGDDLPIDLRGQVIYYVGPTPPRPGAVIGSAGPTTAMRLDPYTKPMLELGLKGIIGKGGRGPAVRQAIVDHHAVYCIAVGGTGALLNRHIKSAEVVAFEDLGTEAIRRLDVEGFPAIVVNDCRGGDLLEAGKAEYRTSSRPIPAVKALGG